MSRWGAVAAALIVLGIASAAASGAAPATVKVAFDRGARLGASTAMDAELRIDSRRAPSPVTEVRILYPKGLGLVSSGLGLAVCRRPPSDFQQVLIEASGLGGCSPNAVLGYGTARAEVRLRDGQIIPEYASLTVLAGPIVHGTLGLVIYVEGEHPFGAKLAYAGDVQASAGPFGALAFHVPAIPSIADLATVALTQMRLSIGSHAIVYHERIGRRTIAYHPDGIGLPNRCPKGGFRFRAQLAFQDGGRAAAATTVRCPPPAARAG